MAKVKKEQFKGQSVEALAKTLREKREALSAFRFGTSKSKTKNTREGRMFRRDIARIMTELTVQGK